MNILQRIRNKAEKLAKVRLEIAEIEERHAKELENLRGQRDQLNSEVLELLRQNELKTIKTSAGVSFTRAVRGAVGFINPEATLAWATKHKAITVDKTRAKALLKGKVEAITKELGDTPAEEREKKAEELSKKYLPDGALYIESEYMSVRGAKKAQELADDKK